MSSQAPQVWVVIAAYNEAPVIASVVADVKRAGYRALVIDDGSTDATGAVAAEAGGSVVRHPINLGQGAGLQTGIEFALIEGADLIVTFDADGQHRAADIAVLIDALARQGADFALGSRFLGTSLNQPLSRRMLLKAATLFTRLTTGLRVTPPCRIRRHRTRCRPRYLYLDRDQSAPSTQSPPQAARAYGADHRTGEGTCYRERPLAPIDVMSPRVAGFRPVGRLIQVAFP